MWLKLFSPAPSAPTGQVVGTFLLLLALATGRHVTRDINGNIENYNDTNEEDLALEDLGSGEEVGEDGEIQCGVSKENSHQTMMWYGHDANKFEHPWQVRRKYILDTY